MPDVTTVEQAGIEKGLQLGVQQSERYTLSIHGHADSSHPARRHLRNLA